MFPVATTHDNDIHLLVLELLGIVLSLLGDFVDVVAANEATEMSNEHHNRSIRTLDTHVMDISTYL